MPYTKQDLAEIDPDILLADGFDDAIIGWTDSWSGNSREVRAVYSVAKCIEILMFRDGMSHDMAEEYFEFNVAGAYCGPKTPVFVHQSTWNS
jgi:hypothetical protein